MKSASIVATTPLLLACVSFLTGCTRPPRNASPTAASQAMQQGYKPPRDDLGREIKLLAPPQRIVTIGPAVTETIFALGEGKRLVGRDQLSDYPPRETSKVAVVGDYNGPAAEKVVAVRPDLIIIQGETYDKARIEVWQQQCGAPVAALAPHSVLEAAQGMNKIGAWLGVPKKAAMLSEPLVLRIRTVPRPQPPITAFFEVSRSPLWTPGRGTLINDVMRLAGLTNIADITGYKQYNLETLTAKQPQFYIVSYEKDADSARTLEELRSQPALRGLKCVRQGRVLVVSADLVVRPGPRLLQGILALEKGAGVTAVSLVK